MSRKKMQNMRTYNTVGVMNNNNKWSSLKLNKDNLVINIPQKLINKETGYIKKSIFNKVDNVFALSIEDIMKLYVNKGVSITTS